MSKCWKLEYLIDQATWVGPYAGHGGKAHFETEAEARVALAVNAFGHYSWADKWRILDPKGRVIQL